MRRAILKFEWLCISSCQHSTSSPYCFSADFGRAWHQIIAAKASQYAARNMFDDMSSDEVVWDAELQHTFDDQHGLLKELAQGGEHHVGETSVPMLLKLGMASVNLMFDEIPQFDVIWDDELSHGLHCQGALVQQEAVFDECLVADNKATIDLLKRCIGTADQVCDGFPSKVVVWDEELFHQDGPHDGLLQQLAGSRESIDDKKAKGVIEVDTDKVLTHISGLSHFLEICETSNADEESELVSGVLTHESALLQHLEISMSSADQGMGEMLELDDQVSCETLCEGNENLQQEEVYVACLGMMLQSAWCVIDQFSPQCLNHQCQDHSCVACYGTWSDQEMASDRKTGFSPGERELQLDLFMMSDSQWDPGISVRYSRGSLPKLSEEVKYSRGSLPKLLWRWFSTASSLESKQIILFDRPSYL